MSGRWRPRPQSAAGRSQSSTCARAATRRSRRRACSPRTGAPMTTFASSSSICARRGSMAPHVGRRWRSSGGATPGPSSTTCSRSKRPPTSPMAARQAERRRRASLMRAPPSPRRSTCHRASRTLRRSSGTATSTTATSARRSAPLGLRAPAVHRPNDGCSRPVPLWDGWAKMRAHSSSTTTSAAPRHPSGSSTRA